MSVNPKLVNTLATGRSVRLEMPGQDDLQEGRETVKRIEQHCGFALSYVQRMGANPEIVMWKSKGAADMEAYKVGRYDC